MSTLENLKEIADLAKKLGNIDLYKKIVELEGEVIELTRRTRVLEDESVTLKRRLAAKEEMKASGPHNYFYRNGNTDGPYCPVCWQRDEKAILLPASADYMTGHERHCQVCKTSFFEGDRKKSLNRGF